MDPYEIVRAFDPEWDGGVPYSMVIGPDGKDAFEGLSSAVSSVNIIAPFKSALVSGAPLTMPTEVTPGIVSTASIMRFCIAGTASPR